eukprot:4465220-Pyramimonas_sp.AAC.2
MGRGPPPPMSGRGRGPPIMQDNKFYPPPGPGRGPAVRYNQYEEEEETARRERHVLLACDGKVTSLSRIGIRWPLARTLGRKHRCVCGRTLVRAHPGSPVHRRPSMETFNRSRSRL